MSVKIIDNISIVQAIPNVNTEIVRDVSKPLSFYLVGTGSGQWSATVTLYEIDPIGYKKIGNDTSFTVTNSNPMELSTWSSNAKSFVIRVSSIKNASVTVYMTQAESSQLERILLTEPSQGTKAMPSDIVGCAAEYVAGQGWIGNLGVLDSKAVLDSFPTNALVPGKVWAIVASASSFAKYNYMSAGWVLESSVGATGASNLPGSPSAPFTTEAERTAWTTANLATLLPGRTTAWGPGNAEYVWNGPLATDWQGIRGPYLGSAENPFTGTTERDAAIPSPSAMQEAWMVNPCVPGGVSRMLYYPTYGWAPAIGTPIIQLWRTTSTPIASLTPGVLTVQKLYESPIIPDYLLPAKGMWEVKAFCSGINSAGVANAMVAFGISGSVPTHGFGQFYNYPLSRVFTPGGGSGTGSLQQGQSNFIQRVNTERTAFNHSNGGDGKLERNTIGPFTEGKNRAYCMVQASKIDDQFIFDGHQYTFVGF